MTFFVFRGAFRATVSEASVATPLRAFRAFWFFVVVHPVSREVLIEDKAFGRLVRLIVVALVGGVSCWLRFWFWCWLWCIWDFLPAVPIAVVGTPVPIVARWASLIAVHIIPAMPVLLVVATVLRHSSSVGCRGGQGTGSESALGGK